MSSDKQTLIASQPTYGGQPPAYGAPVNHPPSYKSGGNGVLDAEALAKLANVEDYTLKQGNVFGEVISCGICANTYVVGDRGNMVHVPGRPENEMVENPLFVVLEEADCWRRCWCCGKHPMLAKFYHSTPVQAGEVACSCCPNAETCCYSGHKYNIDRTKPVVMTVERDGLCNRWVGCCIFAQCCKSEAWHHAGEVNGRPGTLAARPDNRVIGRSVNPADGGCFKPTLNIMEAEPGHPEAHVADMVGPCFYGGCLEICTDTKFSMNSVNAPGSSDLGEIVKRKPEGCWDMCIQCHTDVDNYEISMSNKRLNPLQKANFLATAVHLDYWFYQRDPRPIQNHSSDGRSGVIIITLCMMYVRGCSIPIQVCIPYGQK